MLTKSLLALIIAACGVSPTPATTEPPDEIEPDEPTIKPIESHWCCKSVDPKTATGEGCTVFSGSVEVINTCAEYLHCPGGAAKHDNKVTCL